MRLLLLVVMCSFPAASFARDTGPLTFDFDPHGTYSFGGVVGERVAANNAQWLVRAPAANPGLLAMFRLRDLQPTPQLVPWAGEFVGKYLLSAVQAQRMSNNARLRTTITTMVKEMINSQAADGYLGPFPKKERLLKHWDLWGHYHIIQALLAYHDQNGDPQSLAACRKAADLVCRTYLDSERRMIDAGSDEMNLAIIHALGMLYRLTEQPRYLQMMREIEKDWKQAGDYFRTGMAGVDFYRTPRPRWESLHDLQGLVELYRITNDDRYRTAFLHHWQSIRRWDRRNTGGFSSGEQATGTPYEPTPIETCCTIAWMAITVDALRLTGDPLAADELELSTYNAMLGAQHPSGSWWTYDTPMNGVREASHDTIVFQSRAGTPDLNCCSVNAPRGLGMLSEWAVMRGEDQVIINYLGPMTAKLQLVDGTPISIEQRTTYPMDGKIDIVLRPKVPISFELKVRIPGWVESARVMSADKQTRFVPGGQYWSITRQWKAGDSLQLQIDMPLRFEIGDNEMAGRMSVYRGPLLLAYDFLNNKSQTDEAPTLTTSRLAVARVSIPARTSGGEAIGRFPPWLIVDIPTDQGRWIRLCDFASAGSMGSKYASWLPATNLPPARPMPQTPRDGVSVPTGTMLFTLRPTAASDDGSLHLEFSQSPDFEPLALRVQTNQRQRILLPDTLTQKFQPETDYYWRLVASNKHGQTSSTPPARRFQVDPNLPPLTEQDLAEFGERADGAIIDASLGNGPEPQYGQLLEATGWKPAEGPHEDARAVELDGETGMLVYKLKTFPPRNYTVSFWLSPTKNEPSLGQAFSAWCRGMDDPLRLSVQNGKLYARMEVGKPISDQGTPVEAGRWYHVCAVKNATTLTTYLNGKQVSELQVPMDVTSAARDFALGGNPHYTGSSEHLACQVAQLLVSARAFTPEEVQRLYEMK